MKYTVKILFCVAVCLLLLSVGCSPIIGCGCLSPPTDTGLSSLMLSASPVEVELVSDNAPGYRMGTPFEVAYSKITYSSGEPSAQLNSFAEAYRLQNNSTTESVYVFFDYTGTDGYSSPEQSLTWALRRSAREIDSEFDLVHLYRDIDIADSIVNKLKSVPDSFAFSDFLEAWRSEHCPNVASVAELDQCEGVIVIAPGETKPFHYGGRGKP